MPVVEGESPGDGERDAGHEDVSHDRAGGGADEYHGVRERVGPS